MLSRGLNHKKDQQCDDRGVEPARQRLKRKAGAKFCRAMKARVRVLALIQVTVSCQLRVQCRRMTRSDFHLRKLTLATVWGMGCGARVEAGVS